MERKLYIINNGMKDRRGHYLETAVSVAEAAWSLGLRPLLAAHVSCPHDLVADALEFHPVFTTDHWMAHLPPPQPNLRGIRGELAPLSANSIEALRAGTLTFDQYLRARFDLEDSSATEPVESEPSAPVPPTTLRRTELKRLVRAILPPAVHKLFLLSKAILRQTLPPVIWNRLRSRLKSAPAVVLRDEPTIGGPLPYIQGLPTQSDPLTIQLERIGAGHEADYCSRFRQDLERLLSLSGCAASDHVFLPTAHGRELCAILQLLATLPIESQPTFHLEFRHAVDMAGPHVPVEIEQPYCTVHRAFFDHARRFAPTDRLRLYTDSEELSEEYERFSGLEFGVLPIPFRTQFLSGRSRRGDPLCIAFLGDVREEKGFHWLPGLISAMMEAYLAPGRVRFLIQASLVHPEGEPRCKAALEELTKYSDEQVRLVGLDGPLAPDQYYQVVSEADLLLCPYYPETYRRRSSGTLTEAISAGIPTVVPQDTWLARQQPPGSGETFVDRESFIAAVQKVCDHYAAYHLRATAGQRSWLARHSPERLVRTLLGREVDQSSPMGKVA